MPQISRLEVRGLRGILDQRSLIFDGKSVLLFGENGTGKSSFVDALEWLFTKRITTLDGRAQELSSQKHGPHIRSTVPPFVAVTFSPPENVTVDSMHIPSKLTVSMTEYLNGAKENLYTLRRSQLSRFIDSQPRDRYALLRPFIPLGRIDEIEETFERAAEVSRQEHSNAEHRTARLAAELKERAGLGASGTTRTEADVVASISNSLLEHGFTGIEKLSQIEDRTKEVDDVLAEFGDLSRQSALLGGIQAIDQAKRFRTTRNVEAALSSIAALREKETEEAKIFYESVLEQGAKWIEDEKRSDCPLCEQPINAELVVSRVRARLQEMQEIVRLRETARKFSLQAQDELRSALRSVNTVLESVAVVPDMREHEALAILRTTLAVITENLEEEFVKLEPAVISATVQLLRQGGDYDNALNALDGRLKELLGLLPSQDKARALLNLRQKLQDISRIWLDYQGSCESQRGVLAAANAADRIYKTCQAARKEVVQSLYDELSADINRIYVLFHAGESHGGIRVGIREAVQGSAYLRGNFYDHANEDVRAYYSEAHLDTLGLSIFLALRIWHRRAHPNFNLMVLDDVLTSVDSKHLVKVSELLLKEFSDYQILLTTHDRIWFEHLRDIQSRCRVSNRFVNKVIHRWTIDDGPDLREPEDERSDLELRLAKGESKDIASTAGRLLEHILQEMRYNFRLRIEARRGELYEIGDLWPAFYSEIRKNYPSLYQAAKDPLDALDVQWPLRNWVGAHFNEWAARVSRESSIDFGKAVAKLFDDLFCKDCRRFIEPSATPLGQVACRCGAKLYPAPGKKGVPPSPRAELVAATRGALKDARLDTNVYLELKRAEKNTEK